MKKKKESKITLKKMKVSKLNSKHLFEIKGGVSTGETVVPTSKMQSEIYC